MLSVKALNLTKKKPILRNINLEFPKGRISLLLGKSGSGKTSLLRCIAQIEKNYSGTIIAEEKELSTLSPKLRCQTLGFVSQTFALFPNLNVLENCMQPLALATKTRKKELKETALNRLASLEMEAYAYAHVHELSGGQQQRVAIARALLLNPIFLLFDEPTSALDPENRERFVEIIKKLQAEGKGILLSSQDMDFAKKALDCAYFLEEGEVAEFYDKLTTPALSKGSKLHQFLF